MKTVDESQDGGTQHYVVVPESASELGQPSAEFQAFVRDLNCEPLSTAVSLGQFQLKLEREFVDESTERASGVGPVPPKVF